jgi:presenilin-like A22 family membrane protease
LKARRLFTLKPVFWSAGIFIIALALALLMAWRENPFLAQKNIYVPSQPAQAITIWPGPVTTTSPSGVTVTEAPAVSSLGPILIYFFSAVIVLGAVLFFIPLSALKFVLRITFAFMFGWGAFIILALWLPLVASIALAAAIGVSWFVLSKIWLHNLAMLLSLVALGAVFGRFISPWTSIIMLVVLALYDFLAVRFGYMLWMVKKLSGSTTPPVFILPHKLAEWNSSTKQPAVTGIVETKQEDRLFSILGGGDVGFPALVACSVYFARGLSSAIVIGLFSLLGLIGAYWIQSVFLKGKPDPALPPIAVTSLVGLTLIMLVR